MIDLSLYRFRVGNYNNSKNRRSKQVSMTGNFVPDIRVLDAFKLLVLIYLYIYFALCVMSTIISMALDCHIRPFSLTSFHYISVNEFTYLFRSHTKSYAAVLLFFLFKKDWWLYRIIGAFLILKTNQNIMDTFSSLSTTKNLNCWVHTLDPYLKCSPHNNFQPQLTQPRAYKIPQSCCKVAAFWLLYIGTLTLYLVS
jgi:hypothetical protein